MKKLIFLLLIFPLVACTTKKAASTSTNTATSAGGSATTSNTGSVQLSWNASSGSPSGYYVQQSSDGVNFAIVQTVTSPSASVSGLTRGHTYYFRVQAYNAGGTSGASTVFTAVP